MTRMKEFVDKLIDRLEEYRNFEDHDSLDRQCIDGAIEIVNELAEEYNNGWIPCSKNTPDNRDAVLVCATGKDEGVFISYYIEEEDRWRYDTDDGGHYYVDVIAWQPLPEPYKEEGDNNA